MAELTSTSRLVLGLLRLEGEQTGYELKALADDSTEFFWAASYGRIYPELRRLEEAGLLQRRDEPRGDRPRKLYSLTPAGEQALDEWLTSGGELTFELRDEGLLRFFLADTLPPEGVRANLRAMRARHDRIAARLRELEPFLREIDHEHCVLTLQFGIELHTLYTQWCSAMEERLPGSDDELGGG